MGKALESLQKTIILGVALTVIEVVVILVIT